MTTSLLRTLLACVIILTSVLVLEMARNDVVVTQSQVGRTPVTEYAQLGAEGPVVVIAHGFAGSQQMMQGYALPLARAGYRVFVFEFMGHGRHPDPMSGDVTVIEGTTQLLIEQTNTVIDAVKSPDQPTILLGHSMATDILVRVASIRDDIGPMVLISAFSQVIDATNPPSLLLITGAWEAGLRSFAKDAVKMVSPDASENQTISTGSVTRRASVAPFSEHVSVLQSRTGRREALDWLNKAYGRNTTAAILPTGWAILGVLGGLVLLFPSLTARLPQTAAPPKRLPRRRLAIVALLPMVTAPLIAVPLNTGFLPVLVADYLALHLLVFATVQLALLRYWRVNAGTLDPITLVVLLAWCALFGFTLDRYAANFWPTPQRLWIIAAICIGAVPYMIADAVLARNTSYLGRIALRSCLLLSLGIAVMLDFEGLFFLMMIAPVLILFYAIFATMGRSASQRSGPLASGIALGLVLAWALGVSFPLFQA